MTLRNLRNVTALVKNSRIYSTGAPFVNVEINEKTGIATATLQRQPVNSLNYEMLKQLCDNLEQLENNKSRGLILTSSFSNVFSAGLDILELYKPNIDRFRKFWSSLQQVCIDLHGSSFPTVAVINGHSPAGGCLLSLSCEYRVMLNNFTIGLNEAQLGIVAPTWLMTTMNYTIGSRQSELALTTGTLFNTDEALKIGLIDEIAASKEEGMEKAEKFFQKFAKVAPQARSLTKKSLRRPAIEALEKAREIEIQKWFSFITSPQIQEGLETYLKHLKKRKVGINDFGNGVI